ncbi:hypothetical protein L7F22_053424 [Adiantum nelumboides]|nr:hypothetical protein [Adiantum nelumboides]
MATSLEATMQLMMQQFAVYMQQQQIVQQQYQLQERMRKACQAVTDKLQRFEGRDISKFCRYFVDDPVLNPLTPWHRPPLKNVFCIYGIDLKTEVGYDYALSNKPYPDNWILTDIIYETEGGALQSRSGASVTGNSRNSSGDATNQNQNQNLNQRSSSNRSRPSAGLVPDILGSADADASTKLCRAWGQVRDHQSLIFFDPGARANFITPRLAEKMGIKTDEMGPAYTATMVAPGLEVAVTPLIGKLRLHIQGYVGHEEFFIMPLEGCDVLLGMPWFYNHKALLDSFNKKVTLETRLDRNSGDLTETRLTCLCIYTRVHLYY